MAPSVSPAELPAVTRPPARNGVRSAARPSSVVSGRRNSSRAATRQPSSPKTLIGTTVRDMTPSSSSQARVALTLALERVAVGRLPRQLREGVVEVLGRLAHHGGALVDQPLADEARVEVDLVAHRVMAHVLDAADDHEVGGAHRDLAGAGRRRRQRAGAHAVDREAGDGVGEPREQRDVASERQALVADLRGRGEDHVADALGRHGRVAAEQLADDLDRHVVGARLPEEAARPRLAERGADAVDEDDLVALATHAGEDSPFPPDSRSILCDDVSREAGGRRRPPYWDQRSKSISLKPIRIISAALRAILKRPARGPHAWERAASPKAGRFGGPR